MDELVWIKAIPYRIVKRDGCGVDAWLDGRIIADCDDCDEEWAVGSVILACVRDARDQWKGTARNGATGELAGDEVAAEVPVR